MKLSDILSQKIRASQKFGGTQHTKLANGLCLAVTPDTLTLSRANGEPSELEGHTCARHAGWAAYTLKWDGPLTRRTLVIQKGQGLL